MPKLLITRNSEWANRYRSFDLYMNGIKFAELKDKQTLKFEIPEGNYQLIAKLGRYGSKPVSFKLEKGETKRFEVKGFLFSKYLLPLAIFIALLYFGIYFKFHNNNLILATALMILFGYLFYFLSFGRNQYLRLFER
ncbi:hypothetical protein [Christiangramia echinicola]|uniref:hypothetical protein n=1 Tax=Christiangramia echinicola TaxID=279359 RepID=UPI000412D318|nr:hypothetical protein [Christiangramia echinicola]